MYENVHFHTFHPRMAHVGDINGYSMVLCHITRMFTHKVTGASNPSHDSEVSTKRGGGGGGARARAGGRCLRPSAQARVQARAVPCARISARAWLSCAEWRCTRVRSPLLTLRLFFSSLFPTR